MIPAAVYIRVSTDRQAEEGQGLGYQEARLRDWAEELGCRVVEVVSDPAISRMESNRPGLGRLEELARNGEIKVVLAWKRDRYFGDPFLRMRFDFEMDQLGVKLMALDDAAGEDEDAQIMNNFKDYMGKKEVRKTRERTMAGTRHKVKSGKLIIGRRVNYGFKANEDRDQYLVDEQQAKVVRRIFDLIGVQGKTISATVDQLNAQAIPSPSGGKWNHKTIRTMILDDIYKPHTPPELAALGLQADQSCGVWYYGRRRVKQFRDPETYNKKTELTHTDPENWVAVPVPSLGIPRATVDAARSAIQGNIRSSNAGRRVWELDGGRLRCGHCGWAMIPRTTPSNGKMRFYYVCSSHNKKAKRCAGVKHYRADWVEHIVAETLTDWFRDIDKAEAYVEQRIEAERRKLFSGDPEKQAKALADQIAKLERNKKNYRQQQADDLIPMAELREILADLNQQQQAAKAELDRLLNRQRYMQELENDKTIVLAWYAGHMAAGLEYLTPEQRKDAYRRLHITATMEDGQISVDGWPDANYLPEPAELEGFQPLQARTNGSP